MKFPEVLAFDRRLFPSPAGLRFMLESAIGPTRIEPVLIPHDCTDGFLCAYWRRPAAYLDPDVRGAISSFRRLSDVETGLARLRQDLGDGT